MKFVSCICHIVSQNSGQLYIGSFLPQFWHLKMTWFGFSVGCFGLSFLIWWTFGTSEVAVSNCCLLVSAALRIFAALFSVKPAFRSSFSNRDFPWIPRTRRSLIRPSFWCPNSRVKATVFNSVKYLSIYGPHVGCRKKFWIFQTPHFFIGMQYSMNSSTISRKLVYFCLFQAYMCWRFRRHHHLLIQ